MSLLLSAYYGYEDLNIESDESYIHGIYRYLDTFS